MGAYKQVFTLKDLFTNKRLKKVLPLITYKEVNVGDETKIRTNIKSVKRQVFNLAQSTSKPFYADYSHIRSENTLTLSGNMIGDIDECQNAVYQALMGIKESLKFTANNMNMIRNALKDSEMTKKQNGIDRKLYLRVSSIQEIENMSPKKLRQLMNDIMENIYYGDFENTQKKYKVAKQNDFDKPYEQRVAIWRRKVGIK